MNWKAGCRSAFRNKEPFLFLLPSLLGVGIFVLLPFADVVRRSFYTAVSGEYMGTGNYVTVLQNQSFIRAVKNTLRFTGICLPVLIGLAFLVALLLWKSSYMQTIKSTLLLPMAVPAAAVVLIWKILFSANGIFNAWLTGAGFLAVDFMGSSTSLYVLVLSYVWKNLGYTVVLFLAGLGSISEGILEAGRMDGADEKRLVLYLVIPQLKPMLYTITVLSFLNSFKVFREAYLVSGAYPQKDMYLLQHLFNNWFTNLEFDKMAAAAVCIAVVLFLGILLLQKLWDQDGE